MKKRILSTTMVLTILLALVVGCSPVQPVSPTAPVEQPTNPPQPTAVPSAPTAVPATPSPVPEPPMLEGKLVIFHAGSLTVPLDELTAAFQAQNPKVTFETEASGSNDAARKISELGRDTIAYGIRGDHDDTRFGDMPAHSDLLDEEQIGQIAEYVLSLSGSGSDAAAAEAGAVLFDEEGCSGCHMEGGVGMRELGAPNLTDAIWLFGGDKASIVETIANGRAGVMPTWDGRLSSSQINAVAAYVHQLGGGE